MPRAGASPTGRHSFGGNAATRAQQRAERASGGGNYVKNFREDRTDIRILFEDPKLTWHEFWQHYDKNLRIAGPCGREVFGTCIFCRQPVENEDADVDEKKRDHGWTVRKASQRFVVPVLNDKNYIDLRSVSKTFRDEAAAIFEAVGSVTAQDGVVMKIKDESNSDSTGELRNKYTFTLVGPATDRKLVRELRELYQTVAAGLASTPLSEEQQAANMRWVNGYLALGVPNIGEILGDKYVYALEKYGSSLAQEEALAAQLAEDKGTTSDAIRDLKAQAHASTPAAAPAPSPAPNRLQELCQALTTWKVPYPADATLDQLEALYGVYAPMNQAPATPAAAPAQPEPTELELMANALAEWKVPLPADANEQQIRMMYNAFAPTRTTPQADEPQADPVAALKADLTAWGIAFPDDASIDILKMLHDAGNPDNPANQAAPAAANAPDDPADAAIEGLVFATGGEPNFRGSSTEAVMKWLDTQYSATSDLKYNYDPNAARSELITTAEKALHGF